MSKGIELTPSQIKAHENGATMFIFTIDTKGLKMSEIGLKKDLLQFSPLQKGDKDVFIQEEDCIYWTEEECFQFGVKQPRDIVPASQMAKKQSRYSFKEVLDVRVVRVLEIKYDSIVKIIGEEKTQWNSKQIMDEVKFFNYYNKQMQERNINRTYEDNDYVFLIEIKK